MAEEKNKGLSPNSKMNPLNNLVYNRKETLNGPDDCGEGRIYVPDGDGG